MNYKKELEFLLRFFQNCNINTHFYTDETPISALDLQLRILLGCGQEYQIFEALLSKMSESTTIYKLVDQFYCVYHCINLPAEEQNIPLIIGPYVQLHYDRDFLYHHAEQYAVSPQTFQNLQKLFSQIPVLTDDTTIQTFLQTFGETVWGNDVNFQYQKIDLNMIESNVSLLYRNTETDLLPQFDVQILDLYISQENSLIQAVSQGQTAKAEELLSLVQTFPLAEGSQDMLRNMKNYALALNTLLRKSNELNNSSSHQAISVYMKLSQKIELCSSPEDCIVILREMIRKYCLLVKNQSMKEYSLLVQQTLKQIDMDLSADLSLHTMAKKLNTNASYLSTQFKKVTGSTYTEYVQRKRIEHSLFLLNTTSLQIQTIAQNCGITDLNYFSKLFKKYVNLSPTAYRREIRRLEQ